MTGEGIYQLFAEINHEISFGDMVFFLSSEKTAVGMKNWLWILKVHKDELPVLFQPRVSLVWIC